VTVSVLYREPKLLKAITQRFDVANAERVSVLYREPKLLKVFVTGAEVYAALVSVLYREPKLLKAPSSTISSEP